MTDLRALGLVGGERRAGGKMAAPGVQPLATDPNMHAQSVERAVLSIFAETDLHAKQVELLSLAVIGAVHAAHFGVAHIGRAAAATRGWDYQEFTQHIQNQDEADP